MKKRPLLVWVIFIFDIFSACFALFSMYLVYSGAVMLPPEAKAYLDAAGTMGLLISLVIGGLNIAGAVTLFMLKRVSVKLFSAAFVLNIGVTAVQGIPPQASAGLFIGWAIAAAVIFYSYTLAKKGVLS